MVYLIDFKNIGSIDSNEGLLFLISPNTSLKLLPDMIPFNILNLPDSILDFLNKNRYRDCDSIIVNLFNECIKSDERYPIALKTLQLLNVKSANLYLYFDNYRIEYLNLLSSYFSANGLECKVLNSDIGE